MKHKTTEKQSETAPQEQPHAQLTVQPSGGIEQKGTEPDKTNPEHAKYNPDWLEALPPYEKGLLIASVITVLLYVSFWSGWITEKQTEFFITSLLSFAILLVVIGQAYVSKRQWHAMHEQRNVMQGQLIAMEKTLVQSRELFDIVERPIVALARIEPNKDFKDTGVLNPEMMVRNSGRSGAKYIWWESGVVLGDIPEFPSEFKWWAQLEYLSPHEQPTHCHTSKQDAVSFTPEELSSIMDGTVKLSVIGYGSYKDMSKERDFPITPFAFVYEPDSDLFLSDYFLPVQWENAKASEEPDEDQGQ